MSFTHIYSSLIHESSNQCVWEVATKPFNELIVSWNALRPQMGSYRFSVSVKSNSWSKYLPYAEWSKSSQRTYRSKNDLASTDQDIVKLNENRLANAFRVKVDAVDGADFTSFYALHACASDLNKYSIRHPGNLIPVRLPILSLRSQLTLQHQRPRHLCSPTSTSMAINYLLNSRDTDPTEFAEKAHDDGFDIYGNWILNVAESFTRIYKSYFARVERLSDFSKLHALLQVNVPVVVSVKGPLPGSFFPYQNGHLMLVHGYDKKRVLCVDPAGPSDEATSTQYKLDDFLEAWGRRFNLSYVFFKDGAFPEAAGTSSSASSHKNSSGMRPKLP